MINLTSINFSNFNPTAPITRDSSKSCVEWCIDQQVLFQSSVNQAMLAFIFIAWILLILASYTYKIEKFNKYHESVLHMTRLALVLVVAAWFLFVYLGIVWFE